MSDTQHFKGGRKRLGKRGPEFVWLATDDKLLLFDCDTGRTITNAAEAVIQFLAGRAEQERATQPFNWLPGRRVFYLDTCKAWSELTHDCARFRDFQPISEDEAAGCEHLARMAAEFFAKRGP